LVSADRKPVRWLPPSIVWMVLAKARTFSTNVSLYCSEISTCVPSTSRST
jgi:hypothetical protein